VKAILFVAILLVLQGGLIAQDLTVLRPSATEVVLKDHSYGVQLSGATEGGTEFVVLVNTAQPGGVSPARILKRDASGWKPLADISSMLSQPLGYVGNRFVFSKWNGFRAEVWSLNLTSGAMAQVDTEISPLVIGSGRGNRLALLGPTAGGQLFLDIRDKDLKRIALFELPGLDRSQIGPSYLSFVSDSQLLLIDRSSLAYLPLTLEPEQVKIGPPVLFTGSEVDVSRNWPRPPSPFRQPGRMSAPMLILAHVPLLDGHNMLFLGPYRDQEGYRAAIFDGLGQQVSAFRFQFDPIDAPGAGSFVGYAVQPLLENGVAVTTRRGVRYEFRR
jgi:hypothetical protein